MFVHNDVAGAVVERYNEWFFSVDPKTDPATADGRNHRSISGFFFRGAVLPGEKGGVDDKGRREDQEFPLRLPVDEFLCYRRSLVSLTYFPRFVKSWLFNEEFEEVNNRQNEALCEKSHWVILEFVRKIYDKH